MLCFLVIDKPSNACANGTCFPHCKSIEVTHTVELGESNYRIIVLSISQPMETLPLPIQDDLYYMGNAIIQYVRWPKLLILLKG